MCPDSDRKSTLPKQLDWLNDFSPARFAGYCHDWLICKRVNRFLSWVAYAILLLVCIIVNIIAIPFLVLGLAVYEMMPKKTQELLRRNLYEMERNRR